MENNKLAVIIESLTENAKILDSPNPVTPEEYREIIAEINYSVLFLIRKLMDLGASKKPYDGFYS